MLWCFLLSAPLRMLWNQNPFYMILKNRHVKLKAHGPDPAHNVDLVRGATLEMPQPSWVLPLSGRTECGECVEAGVPDENEVLTGCRASGRGRADEWAAETLVAGAVLLLGLYALIFNNFVAAIQPCPSSRSDLAVTTQPCLPNHTHLVAVNHWEQP